MYFELTECMKWAVEYISRNNTMVNRDECITKIADLVGSTHKVDLSHPELVVLVDIFKVTFIQW